MNIHSWLYWNPPRDAFTIPYFDIIIAWYGIIFALGFIAGYYILLPIIKKEFSRNPSIYSPDQIDQLASQFADKLIWFIILGTVIGARLGHVLFYDWDYYKVNPIEILMIRKGGLASHGGTVGVMIGLFIFLRRYHKQFPTITFIKLMDILVIPTAMTITFIRIANFFNQEILGHLTTVPWAVIFGNAADGTPPAPRHPVQLYEAGAYFLTFIGLFILWKFKKKSPKTGTLSGLFFISVFGFRFFIEYLKEPQSSIDHAGIHMGQYLSIPFILLGFILLIDFRPFLNRIIHKAKSKNLTEGHIPPTENKGQADKPIMENEGKKNR